MAIRKILLHPDSRLRQKSQYIDVINDKITTLVKDMFDTMYFFKGVGLAAPQINAKKRVIVIDVSKDRKTQYVLINPEIIECSGSTTSKEGCLSLPKAFKKLSRKKTVKVKAQDINGKVFILETKNKYLSSCLQHEIDHLDGILISDQGIDVKHPFLLRVIRKIKLLLFN